MRRLALFCGGFAAGIFLAQYLLLGGWLLPGGLVCLALGFGALLLPECWRKRAILCLVGVALALFLFTFLPTFLTGLVMRAVPLGRWPRVILEGVLKMVIFLGYMFLCTRMKELHRVFEYHGAEHKTIACYEAGLPLTVENIRRQSRFHPRCGTSFMILVIIISIFLYAVLPWTSTAMRVVYKLCMFPLLVGISYEILKWAGRSDSAAARIISQPGL